MMVVSRQPRESMYVGSDSNCLITVLKLYPKSMAVSVLISRASVAKAGLLDSQIIELRLDRPYRIDEQAEVVLVVLRAEKARLGFNVTKGFAVHRLEVWNAINAERGREIPDNDTEDGPTGSPVPKTPKPMPPSLDVRLEEPKSDS